ncbi:MAG TPA: hypothetical protein VKB96_02610, partial [Gammaproteobacteria bacterium]|nr:hypothetical protein [Gammaproteobacteria bacterium]
MFGAVGGCMSLRWVPQLGVIAKLSSIFSAMFLAFFITPIVAQTTGIRDQHVLYGAAGLIGVFGLSITASLFDTLRATKWSQIVEKRLGLDPD